MRIGVVQASSQIPKNELLYQYTKQYARGATVINLGCYPEDREEYSYPEIALLIGLLLDGGFVDFVVTGCSSGQGMMLACNAMPGVLCGYAPTPRDASLFAQINNGNAVSLPLGEGYTYRGEQNLANTLKALFSVPFGQGYPPGEAGRKIADANTVRQLKARSQLDFPSFFAGIDEELRNKVLGRMDDLGFPIPYNHEKE